MLLLRSTLLLACFVCAALAHAETKGGDAPEQEENIDRYQIEFILFKQPDPDESILEFERIDTPRQSADNPVYYYPYGSEALTDNHLATIDNNEERLLANASLRMQKRNYEILASGAWQQALAQDSRSRPLLLRTEPVLSPLIVSNAVEETNEPAEQAQEELHNRDIERFDGSLVIRRSRFTHAELSLDYLFQSTVHPISLLDYVAGTGLQRIRFLSLVSPNALALSYIEHISEPRYITTRSFRFEESRRVKSGEIHYLDHPFLGFLVAIKRLPQDELQ